MTAFCPTYPQILSERKRVSALRRHLGDDVGKAFIFGEPQEPRSERLYPRRAGCVCTVIRVSEERCSCPLVVRFQDGFVGIAEREWLSEMVSHDESYDEFYDHDAEARRRTLALAPTTLKALIGSAR